MKGMLSIEYKVFNENYTIRLCKCQVIVTPNF